jgi:hypothetical protein
VTSARPIPLAPPVMRATCWIAAKFDPNHEMVGPMGASNFAKLEIWGWFLLMSESNLVFNTPWTHIGAKRGFCTSVIQVHYCSMVLSSRRYSIWIVIGIAASTVAASFAPEITNIRAPCELTTQYNLYVQVAIKLDWNPSMTWLFGEG